MRQSRHSSVSSRSSSSARIRDEHSTVQHQCADDLGNFVTATYVMAENMTNTPSHRIHRQWRQILGCTPKIHSFHIIFLDTFNGPLSGTTRVSRYQKSRTNLDFTEARDSEWQWHQLGHMQVCTSLQTDNHTSTPRLSFLQAGCPSCHPTNSVKALKEQSQYIFTSVCHKDTYTHTPV